MTRSAWWTLLIFVVWTVGATPVRAVLAEHGLPAWIATAIYFAGIAVLVASLVLVAYSGGSPLRQELLNARRAHPGAEVYGILLDPLWAPLDAAHPIPRRTTGCLVVDEDGVALHSGDVEIRRSTWADLQVVDTTVLPRMIALQLELREDDDATSTWWLPLIGEKLGLPRGRRAVRELVDRLEERRGLEALDRQS